MKEYQVGKYTIQEYSDGSKYWHDWYLNDQRHREDGPAVERSDGYKEWWLNNKLHREDGPAVECRDGNKAWYLNGQPYTESQYKTEIRKMKLERIFG